MMELFLSEGKSLTDNIEDGNILYEREEGDFSLVMFVYTYERKINIFLRYKENDIFSGSINNITKLKKEDNYLKIYRKDIETTKVFFDTVFTIDINGLID